MHPKVFNKFMLKHALSLLSPLLPLHTMLEAGPAERSLNVWHAPANMYIILSSSLQTELDTYTHAQQSTEKERLISPQGPGSPRESQDVMLVYSVKYMPLASYRKTLKQGALKSLSFSHAAGCRSGRPWPRAGAASPSSCQSRACWAWWEPRSEMRPLSPVAASAGCSGKLRMPDIPTRRGCEMQAR